MNIDNIVNNIQEKLGEESSAKIGDDLANLLIIDETNKTQIIEKDNTIQKLKNDKDMLIQSNGNLLLQVSQSKEPNHEDNTKEDNKPFDFRTIFENGKFKR